jgi:hypothetical protein
LLQDKYKRIERGGGGGVYTECSKLFTKYNRKSNMADDLEENYEIEEAFLSNSKKRPQNNDLDAEFDVEPQGDVIPVKKQKKKTITEILEIHKDEINKPSYARNELIRILDAHIDKNLSIVEKNDLNLSQDSHKYLNKIILKRKFIKLSLCKQFERKFDKKIEKYLKLAKKVKNGQPFAIVLCSSAQRCIDFQKLIDNYTNKRIRWMYAFAKHKKLAEQIDYLKKNRVNIVFATPNRLLQLLEECEDKANFFKFLKYLIIDYTHRDCKLKRFIDINEIKSEFIKFFFNFIQPVNCKSKSKAKIKLYLV